MTFSTGADSAHDRRPRPRPRRLAVREPQPARRGHLALGEPSGRADRFEVTSRSIERGGRPWMPVTGEVHYSRLPRERWSEVLGHAAAGGLNSVATYVLWQAHEPTPGEFVWTGNRDLRAFVECAGTHGLDVIVRMGPWAHGEARHGGFPDWLVECELATRTNDPEYLRLVRRLYGQIIAQVAGLTHAEGGPVIGAQMDNELYDQPEHLAMLRTIAEERGLDVPLWTATGWGGAQVPDSLLPLYGAYADGFWEDSETEWPAFSPIHFRYSTVRDDLSVGADLREALDGVVVQPGAVPLKDDAAVPFATCELGGGMHVAYHRRPLVTPRDVANLALAKIGSGSIWQGYYMYSGGTQRVGVNGTEQESQATAYPNDVPTRTYDFAAPIGEHGQIRPHHHLLRRQHLWLAQEGHALAAMDATVGGGSDDPAELRWAVRADGARGYVFATTYQPDRQPLQAHSDVQFEVEFPDAIVTVPHRPVDLPAGVSVAWPLRLPLAGGQVLRSATAQLVTRLDVDDKEIVVLAATPGVPVELVLEGLVAVEGRATASHVADATVVTLDSDPGPHTTIDLPHTRLLILDEDTANQVYVLDVAAQPRLVLSDAPVYARDGGLVVHTERPEVNLRILPPVEGFSAQGGTATQVPPQATDMTDATPASALWPTWQQWTVTAPPAGTQRLAGPAQLDAPHPPPITAGGPMGRLTAPTDYTGAATLSMDLPHSDADRALLRVAWTGDVARALVDGDVISDHYWHGREWDMDVTGRAGESVTLEMLPWRRDVGVWVDPSVRDVSDGIHVKSVDLVHVAKVTLHPTGGQS